MHRHEFSYGLPDELIAQTPPETRGSSRLLVMSCPSSRLLDVQFNDLPDFLQAGDLLVFNDTRVLPARLSGYKETGGKVSILLERILSDKQMLTQVGASNSLAVGSIIYLHADIRLKLRWRQHDMFVLDVVNDLTVLQVLEQLGRVPLPPYIRRPYDVDDVVRYQTVYANKPGAVAAPTAGLHFTESLIDDIRQRGIDCAFITLHVGAGTFQPVRTDDIEDHHMHSEFLQVSADVCAQIECTKANGGRVIAVGTTVVRALETVAVASQSNGLQPYEGDTDIFIYPGYRFRIVDALVTNFHLPESTLLMLVAAFSGRERLLVAYHHAIMKQYQFFSYGDAMFLVKDT